MTIFTLFHQITRCGVLEIRLRSSTYRKNAMSYQIYSLSGQGWNGKIYDKFQRLKCVNFWKTSMQYLDAR